MIQSDQNSTATRQWLLELYEGKKSKQPGYSLRQFGRFLGVSPATISQVLSGKRSIGRRVAQVIASNTGMSSLESRRFLTAAATEAYFMQDQGAAAVERLLLDHETFKVLSEWYHFAILSLGDTRNNVDSVPFISAQLDYEKKYPRCRVNSAFSW